MNTASQSIAHGRRGCIGFWGNGTVLQGTSGEGTDSTHWISRSTVVTLTTTPLIVAPQSIPRIGIYASGAQNLLFSIANRLPRSETGMVDPTIASKTAGNCQNTVHQASTYWEVPCGTKNGSVSRSTLETGGTLTMPENLRFDLLTVQECKVSIEFPSPALSCGATVSITAEGREGSRPHPRRE